MGILCKRNDRSETRTHKQHYKGLSFAALPICLPGLWLRWESNPQTYHEALDLAALPICVLSLNGLGGTRTHTPLRRHDLNVAPMPIRVRDLTTNGAVTESNSRLLHRAGFQVQLTTNGPYPPNTKKTEGREIESQAVTLHLISTQWPRLVALPSICGLLVSSQPLLLFKKTISPD